MLIGYNILNLKFLKNLSVQNIKNKNLGKESSFSQKDAS